MQTAISYLRRAITDISITSVVIETIEAWKTTFSSEKRSKDLTRQITTDDGREALVAINEFFGSIAVKDLVQSLHDKILQDCILTNYETNQIVTFLFVCLICGNWQRPGAIINLTLDEALAGVELNGKLVLKSKTHKTTK